MAARKKPQKQGDQDGACGFYSIGNAISLLYPELDVDLIFHHIFRHYFTTVSADHFRSGLGRRLLNELLSVTLDSLLDDGVVIEVSRPFWQASAHGLKAFRDVMAGHFSDGGGVAAIIVYQYCRSADEEEVLHWTVVRDVTPRTMRIFDSDLDREVIRFSRCRVAGQFRKHRKRPYLIRTPYIFLLRRVD
jgi:hypothetical protein